MGGGGRNANHISEAFRIDIVHKLMCFWSTNCSGFDQTHISFMREEIVPPSKLIMNKFVPPKEGLFIRFLLFNGEGLLCLTSIVKDSCVRLV